jgi:hypothetical protein
MPRTVLKVVGFLLLAGTLLTTTVQAIGHRPGDVASKVSK